MKHFYWSFLLISTFLWPGITFGQDCNCDHVITPNNIYIDGSKMNIKPGDVICIKAGQYKYLNLFNFSGTADKPITFINCGGQVKIGGYQHYYGLLLNNVNYFRFTGTGTSGITYGFKIDGVNSTGSGVAGYGTHAEIDHLEISRTGFAGILYKNDPSCDPSSWRQNFVMRQVSIHDNYVHDTHGEGLYIGYTGDTRTLNCNGKSVKAEPHNIEGLRVFDNRIENTGWDGIQVSRATKDCEIFRNTVKNFGMAREQYQDEGILIGGGTTGKLYNNIIIKGTGVGIQVFGSGDNYVYNNVIVDAAVDGIFCDDRETVKGRGFYFINNTIINPGEAGMRMYSRESSGNVFYNNIVVGADENIILLNAPIDWKASHNVFLNSVSEAGFVNAGNHDYHLKSGAKAVNAGKDVSSYKVKADHDDEQRPQGGGYDAGAFEFTSGETAPSNASPSVDAGQSVTLTLPNNSATLTAEAKDTDGKIVQYAWSQASGPSSATLSGQNTGTLKIGKLQEGTYVFNVTVTDDDKATASDKVDVVVKTKSSGSAANGLQYAYYEGNWSQLPDFSRLKAKKTGNSSNFSLDTRLRNEYYGYVFTGSIEIKAAGQYTFYTASDDGSALYIDGKKVVNNDGLHAREEKSGSISLSQGRHTIKVVFFEKAGSEVLEVRYSGPGLGKQLIPNGVLYPDNEGQSPSDDEDSQEEDEEEEDEEEDDEGEEADDESDNKIQAPVAAEHGLRYAYYEGNWDYLPNFSTLNAKKEGTVSNFTLAPRSKDSYFAFTFEGYIEIKAAGQYTFYTASDDGSALFIDGKKVVDNDGFHAEEEKSGSINLSQGFHQIKVTFFEKWGSEILKVSYSGPGMSKRSIPDQVLYQNTGAAQARIAQNSKGNQEIETESLSGINGPFSVSVFPNPIEEVIHLAVEGVPVSPHSVSVLLYDLTGQVKDITQQLQYEGAHLRIHTAALSLPAGVYFLNLTTQEGKTARIKIIKK